MKTAFYPILFLMAGHDLATTVSTAVMADAMCAPHLAALRASDQVEGCKGVMCPSFISSRF